MAVVSSYREAYPSVGQRTQPLLPVVSLWRNCRRKAEEGGDDVKSVLPLCLGLEACYNGAHNGLQHSDVKPIP